MNTPELIAVCVLAFIGFCSTLWLLAEGIGRFLREVRLEHEQLEEEILAEAREEAQAYIDAYFIAQEVEHGRERAKEAVWN